MKPKASEWGEIRGAVARGWTHPKTENKEMDVDLAEAISQEVKKLLDQQKQEIVEMVRGMKPFTRGSWVMQPDWISKVDLLKRLDEL